MFSGCYINALIACSVRGVSKRPRHLRSQISILTYSVVHTNSVIVYTLQDPMIGAGEMALQLEQFALLEDPGSIPSTHLVAHSLL